MSPLFRTCNAADDAPTAVGKKGKKKKKTIHNLHIQGLHIKSQLVQVYFDFVMRCNVTKTERGAVVTMSSACS